MNFLCLEVNDTYDVNLVSIELNQSFNMVAASLKEVNRFVIRKLEEYYNGCVSLSDLLEEIEFYYDFKPSFILLNSKQIKEGFLEKERIVIGKKNQQLFLLEIDNLCILHDIIESEKRYV